MRFSPFLLLVFLCVLPLSAAEPVSVATDSNGITIRLDRVSTYTQQIAGGQALRINSRYSAAGANALLDTLELLVALPDGALPKAEFVIGKEEDAGAIAVQSSARIAPTAELRAIGVQRGVHMAVLKIFPYRYNAALKRTTVVASGRVYMRFEQPLSEKTAAQPMTDAHLFAAVVNKAQIPAIRRNSVQPLGLTTIDETNDWYTKDGVFVKITTTRDGAARIPYEDVVAAEPAFAGVQSGDVRLLRNGAEYPCLFFNDNDGVFNAGDEILFMGRRAYGDTTWFDTYTSECSFFLTVRTGQPPARLSWYEPPASASAELRSVVISEHIERDRDYHLGDDLANNHIATLHRTETMFGEGWYWGDFSYDPGGGSNFEYLQMITPSDNPDDELSIGYYYHSKSNNRSFSPDHATAYFINHTELARDTFEGYLDTSYIATLPASQLLAGANQLRLRATGVPEYRNQPNYTEVSALNYFTLQGRAKPYALHGTLAFSTENLAENSAVKMAGFSAAGMYVIDTLAGTVGHIQGTPGTTVRLGARTGNAIVTSVSINDSIAVYSLKAGLAIAIAPSPNFSTLQATHYTDPAALRQQIVDRIQQAPAGSVIAVACAGVELPQEVRSALQSLGSANVQEISTTTAWIFAARKGADVAVERIANNDIVSNSAFIEHSGGASFAADLRLVAGQSHQVVITDDRTAEKAGVVRMNHLDLRDRSQQADVIIITHRDFMASADSLARYRRVRNGVSVEVVDVEDIYKQFSYGQKSPHGIKQFLSYAYANWAPPKLRYLILFGDASWDPRNISPGAITHDFVPVYGRPVSDYWYTLVDGNDWLPDFIVGRLSVETASQAASIVDKIVEYENMPKRPWMKHFLLLAGGQGDNERRFFRTNTLLQMDNHILVPPLCPTIDTVFKNNDDEASVSQASAIRGRINSGTVWVSYVGHASPVTFDMDFGKADDLSNGNKYPVLATYSCQTAAFAEPMVTGKNEDFVREPGKGFIGAFGTTGFGEVNVDYETANFLYRAMREDSLRSLGDILFYAKSRMAVFADGDYAYQNTLSQHSLLGDPLVELAIDRTTDLYLLDDDIAVTNAAGSPVVSENDSVVTLHSWLRNGGTQAKFHEGDTLMRPVEVLITHRYNDQLDSTWLSYDEICLDIPFSIELNIAGQPGVHYLALYADPHNYSPETNRTNNVAFDTLTVYPARAFALDPLPYWNVDADAPVFRLVNPLNIDSLQLEFALSDNGSANGAFAMSSPEEIEYTEAYTQWEPDVQLVAGASYWVHVRTRDSKNEHGVWSDIPFTASRGMDVAEVRWSLRRAAHFEAGSTKGFTAEEEGDSVRLELKNYTIPVRLRSNGNGEPDRDLLIEANNIEIASRAKYEVGFNVAVLPRGSTKHRVHRWFYTFPFPNQAAKYNSHDLISFLRDSVYEGEILLLAVYDEGFAGPATVDKNLDTLAEVLKLYGSQITDSLFGEGKWRSINSSYVLIAKRGELIEEKWKKDTIEHTGVEIVRDIEIENLAGDVTTAVAGPATRWQSLQLARDGDSEGVQWNTTVIGRKANGEEQELITTASATVDLSTVDAAVYPYLRFEVAITRATSQYNPVLTGLYCSFVPTAEFAALQRESGPLVNDVMRGGDIPFRGRIQNISRRVASMPARVDVDIRPKNGNNAPPLLFSAAISPLEADEVYEYDVAILTAELAPVSSVDLAVYASDAEEELYLFNNRQKYEIRSYEDTVKPAIVLEMDGKEVHENDYVALHPHTVVRVTDNSPLRITASKKVVVRLNGKYLDSSDPNMVDYEFVPLPEGNDHVHVKFVALLEPGYNSLRVVAEDATGNRDTLDRTFIVAEKPVVEKITSTPNPFSDQMYVSFTVGDQQSPTDGEAVIYNAAGRLVRRIPLQPQVGLNTFLWDATDAEKRRVATGAYLIRVYIRGSGGMLESRTQKVIVVQ